MAIRTITVSTAAELTSALSTATGGETILLKPGTYGDFTLNRFTSGFDFTYDAEVTIRSANLARPAVFTGMDVRGATNLTFEGLTFDYSWKAGQAIWGMPFSLKGGSDITFRGCTFDGDIIKSDNAYVGFASCVGLQVGGVTNLTIEDNEFHTFWRGLAVGGSDNVRIAGNNIHSIRMDGMNISSTQGVLIENNHIHDFKRAPNSAEHADMIQFWTEGGSRPSSDIVIRNNLLDIGAGDNTQSIFMRNEMVDTGRAGAEMYYRNVLIEQNTIYNDHLHGISLGHSAGAVIRNNSVLHANGKGEGPMGEVSFPIISVARASTDVSITDNITYRVKAELAGTSEPPAGWTVANNLLLQDNDASRPMHYSDHFVSTSLDPDSSTHDYLALPGGLIETMGVGSDRTMIDTSPAAITPLFHVGTLAEDDSVLVFDAAGLSFGPGGPISPEQGRFLWNFGDGTTAEGGVVTHRYAAPGSYPVTLSVLRPDGSVVSVTEEVREITPDLVRFDSRTGRFGVVPDDTETMLRISPTALAGPSGAKMIDIKGESGVVAAVPFRMIDSIFGADNLAIDLRLRADASEANWGGVFRLHNAFTGSVEKNGNFTFTLATADAPTITLTTRGANLLDGAVHDVSIRYDADAGFVKLTVDGIHTAEAAVTTPLRPMGVWDLVFGNQWGGKNFDGKVLAFDLDVARSDYPTYVPTPAGGPLDSDPVPAPDGGSAPLPQPTPESLDDYLFDDAAMLALRARQLTSDAHVTQAGGETVLAFDGIGDRVVLGQLAQFEAAEKIAFAVDFRRTDLADSSGTLASNADQVSLSVVGDGFRLRVATADEGMKAYSIGQLGLNDTDWHEAMVIIDAEADRLQVFLDDRMVLEDRETDLVMTNPAGGSGGGWVLGLGLEGQIAEFRLDDDIGHHVARGDVTLFA